jgi:hypothetical protein
MGFHEDLDCAARIAVWTLLDLLEKHCGMTRRDAYRLASVAADLSVTQVAPSAAERQAITYGFLSADKPHLHLLTDKVRSGSRRRPTAVGLEMVIVDPIGTWDVAHLSVDFAVAQAHLAAKLQTRIIQAGSQGGSSLAGTPDWSKSNRLRISVRIPSRSRNQKS